jgi:hypothetical protein
MVGGHSVHRDTNDNASKEQEGLDLIVSNEIRSQKGCSEIRFEPGAGRGVRFFDALVGQERKVWNEGIDKDSLFVGGGFVSFVRYSYFCPEQAEGGVPLGCSH